MRRSDGSGNGHRDRGEQMLAHALPDNFYDLIKPSLFELIGRELRLARHVLDLGCGSCELVSYLASAYRQKVIGIDISGGSFPADRRTAQRIGFRCRRQDAAHLDFVPDRSVDAVVTMWALHEMAEPQKVLEEARRVLRPGGEILVVDFPRDSLAQRLWNEDYYRPDEIRRLLKRAGFEDVRIRLVQQDQVVWVRGHQAAEAVD